jgi:hypothetical protein
MDNRITYDVSEEEVQEAEYVDHEGGKVELLKHFCQLWKESAMHGNTS